MIRKIKNDRIEFDFLYSGRANQILFPSPNSNTDSSLVSTEIAVEMDPNIYQSPDFLLAYNEALIESIAKKGKLLFLVHKNETEFNYFRFEKRLNIASDIIVLIEAKAFDKNTNTTVEYLIIENDPPLNPGWTYSKFIANRLDEIFKEQDVKLFL